MTGAQVIGSRWEFQPDEWDKEVRRELLRIKARRRAMELDALERAKKRPKMMDTILTPEDLDNLPPVQYLIEGVLPQNAYGLLTGRDSAYKTFVSLDMSLSLATGEPWLGKPTQMPEGRPSVLYVASEGAYGIVPRIRAWESYRGVRLLDRYRKYREGSPKAVDHPDGTPTFHLKYTPVNLFAEEEADELCSLIRLHSDVGFVVVDTLRRSSGRAEQNGSDMGVVIDNISRIKEATDGGSVLVIAHTDKGDNDTRGSSLIEDDADVVWHARRPEDTATRKKPVKITLVNRKMKDGPTHEKIVLEPKPVEPSVVMVLADAFDMADGTNQEREVLNAIKGLSAAGQNATKAAIKTAYKDETGQDIADSSLFGVLKTLKDKGVITQDGKGKPYEPVESSDAA